MNIKFSLVIPCFNEERSLNVLIPQLVNIVTKNNIESYYIYRMSIEQAEKEYLKYLQKKHKESRKIKAEIEAGPITVIANPPVDSEAEVVTQVSSKRGRKPKQIIEI